MKEITLNFSKKKMLVTKFQKYLKKKNSLKIQKSDVIPFFLNFDSVDKKKVNLLRFS